MESSNNASSIRKLTEERNSLGKEIFDLNSKIAEQKRKIQELEAKARDVEKASSGGFFSSLLNRITNDDPRQKLKEEIQKTRQSRDALSRNLEEKKRRLSEVKDSLARAASQARQKPAEKQPQKANPPAPASAPTPPKPAGNENRPRQASPPPAAPQPIQKPADREKQPQKANPPAPASAPAPRAPVENESQTGKADPGTDSNQKEMPGSQDIQATGNLYLDFSKNAEEHLNTHFKGLRKQLLSIRNKSGGSFFPDSPDERILADFEEAFFPEDFSQSYYISNLSLYRERASLCIRPQIVGPRLERLLPPGKTLVVRGTLGDTRRSIDNPVLLVEHINLEKHFERREFEQAFSGRVFRKKLYPSGVRNNNALTDTFVRGLPLISVRTRDCLKEWHEYLDWKERVVGTRHIGIRYIKAEQLDSGLLRFTTVCGSWQDFNKVKKMLRNDMCVYDLNASTGLWTFKYNKEYHPKFIRLGYFQKKADEENIPMPGDTQEEVFPWEKPYFSHVYFRSSPDEKTLFEDYPQQGFLVSSVSGDLALVSRQRAELLQLQKSSGYAPFLSSYLFDIRTAARPAELKEISGDEWGNRDLNDDQRHAVRIMVSAPDIALIQGPPGTGKTTMIAEAIWQLAAHGGKKVLLASQASLAVNNVLERLKPDPAIRAIRLSQRKRDNEREHPYSQEQALATYYRSIAKTCRNRTLDVWEEADERKKALEQWIRNFELVSADLQALQKNHDEMADEGLSLEKELQTVRKARELSERIGAQKSGMAALKAFINGGEADDGPAFSDLIPEELLETFRNTVIRPIGQLTANGEYGMLKAGDAPGSERDTFLRWRKIAAFRHQIAGDMQRLQNTDSSGPEARLAELQRELEALRENMDGEEALARYDALQDERRRIKRQLRGGLDREVYSELFDTSGSMIFQESDPAKIAAFLGNVHGAICRTEAEVMEGIQATSEEIDRYADSIPDALFDSGHLRELEGRERNLRTRRNENLSVISSKKERLKELLEEKPVSSGTDDPGAYCEQVRQELGRIEETIGRSRAFRASWEEILRDWTENLADAETIKYDNEHFRETYVRSCNIVGVTCTESKRTLTDTGHDSFDTAIIDEVSKATPPEIIMPLMMARTAILVGDHRQLPPLFTEQQGSWEEAAEEEESGGDSELTEQNFERFKKMVTSSLFKEHFEKASADLKALLWTQYRMHPQIMNVINHFYERRLLCGLSDPEKTRAHNLALAGPESRPYLSPEQHVLWLDSGFAPDGTPCYEEAAGTSKTNALECILIARVLHDIELAYREQGFGSNGRPKKEVGIITFYGRQAGEIRKAINNMQRLHDFSFKAIACDINTVDKYQGQERPIILVSMVRNPKNFKLSSLANTAKFERINVAFSRAQELLIITGSRRTFSDYTVRMPAIDRPEERSIKVYKYIIDEIQRDNGLRRADRILSKNEYRQICSHLHDQDNPKDMKPQHAAGKIQK